jgi:uncharacterized protein (TIGR03067 family)
MRLAIALTIATVVYVAGIGRTQDADKKKEDAVKKELALLRGKWEMVGREVMGKKATKEDLEIVKGILVIEGEKKTGWPVDMGKKGEVQEATIKLDPTVKPKAVDKTVTMGTGKGETFLGIYELDGDQLTICIAWGNKERPTEFAGKEDGKAILVVYKRVKK